MMSAYDRWVTSTPWDDEEPEVCTACGGWGCVDGCGDCAPTGLLIDALNDAHARLTACPACGQAGHDIQACGAIRALLFAD